MKKNTEPKAPKPRKVRKAIVANDAKPARRMKNKTRNMLLGYAFILPWFIGLLVFTAWPVIYSMYLSLCRVAVTTSGIDAQFTGFVNYVQAFREDINWSGLLVNQSLYVLGCTPLIIVFSVIMALLLNQKVRGRLFFRALYFFPVIIISGPVMKELLTNNASSVITAEGNAFYQIFSQIPYIGDAIIFAFSELVLILWYSGVQVLIFLAWLQKIDKSMYEAARIDGASGLEIFWKLTIVQLKPMALINAIFTIVQLTGFTDNDVNTYISSQMFEKTGKIYSYSSALAWSNFLVVLLMIGLAFLVFRSKREKVAKA